ncbi:zincin [Serendipita vermifera]|nr:zincin [Serendipita vermifera]
MASDNVPNIRVPQPAIRWNHTPQFITSETEKQITTNRKLYDSIAALKPEECNFQSVFNAIAEGYNKFQETTSPLIFYTHVTPKDDLRNASIAAEEELDKYAVEVEMRADVYQAILHAEKNIKDSNQQLTPEEKRLVEKMVLEGKRAGLALPEEKREQLKTLKKDLAKKCQDFSNNCNQEKGYLDFLPEDLEGVPDSAKNGYAKQPDGTLRVTFKTPDSLPMLQYAKLEETRKRMFAGMEDRLKINKPVLDEILELRRKCAELLGYETWAAYVLEDRMIKSADAAKQFLVDLQQKLNPIGQKDLQNLLALKKEECEKANVGFDGQLNVWDWRYFDRLYVEKTYSLDQDRVKEHFPVEVVVPAIMDIYKEIFNARISEVKDNVVWHQDVKQYAVWEEGATDETGFLGYLHLDLYPRENKYGHAAVWGLIGGYEMGGKRAYPVTCMVANLAKPTPDRPGLMSHDDVVTFFHEMGHAWHGLLSRTRYSRFHGTSVTRDFVEAPSQMLENWCFEEEVLKKISKHYKDGTPLPDELIKGLKDSRYVNIGLFYLRQVYIGMFDQALHNTKERVDATKLWNEMREKISLVKGFPENEYKPGYGSVGHLAGGYDAQYYGYAYSLVFAYDMYETVFAKNPLSPDAGQRYRQHILRPGGSRDEMESLKAFLGREPNAEAFAKALFGSQE